RSELGHKLPPNELPNVRVAEEGRDVDEDRVEEERELPGMYFELVEVVRVALDPDLGEPCLYPPLEAGQLVTGEVEAAVPLQVREQGLDVIAHRHPPPRSARMRPSMRTRSPLRAGARPDARP